jgi:hypothetical protein
MRGRGGGLDAGIRRIRQPQPPPGLSRIYTGFDGSDGADRRKFKVD